MFSSGEPVQQYNQGTVFRAVDDRFEVASFGLQQGHGSMVAGRVVTRSTPGHVRQDDPDRFSHDHIGLCIVRSGFGVDDREAFGHVRQPGNGHHRQSRVPIATSRSAVRAASMAASGTSGSRRWPKDTVAVLRMPPHTRHLGSGSSQAIVSRCRCPIATR